MSADSTESSAPKRARVPIPEEDDDGSNNEAMCQSPIQEVVSSMATSESVPLRQPVICHPISSSTNGKDSSGGQALDLSSHPSSMEVATGTDSVPGFNSSLGTSIHTESSVSLSQIKFNNSSLGTSIHTESSVSLSQIEFKRSLNDIASRKVTIFEGSYNGSPAVVMLEKTPFNESTVRSLIDDSTSERSLSRDFVNDVYGKYSMYPSSELNGIKTTIIHPATESHIEKYMPLRLRMVTETAQDYQKITLPFIQSSSFDITWVYNILEHKQEADRIVFEDSDPMIGFILLPDLKWSDQSNLNDLYLVAIVHRRDLKSLRDLNGDHLSLLKNIKKKGVEAIRAKYQGINESNLRIYFHYQPSYYHLHVHFTALQFEAPGCKVERAHLLDHVINNIEMVPDYYARSTITFCERSNSKLAALFDSKVA